MEDQKALKAYIEAVIRERERYLARQALRKTGADPSGAPENEQAFESALYHLRRADKVSASLWRGELPTDYYRADFDLLAPLITNQLDSGEEIDLDFLRSVRRCRVSPGHARAAIRLVTGERIRTHLGKRMGRLTADAEERTARYLMRGSLAPLVPGDRHGMSVHAWLMKNVFQCGLPVSIIDSAYSPETLISLIRRETEPAFPSLKGCRNIRMPGGDTVGDILDREYRAARDTVIARTRKRFSTDRIRRLIGENTSVRHLQKRADALAAGEKQIRSALLDAVPAHYRDLYPAARAMRRRFILHLGPTNSGKTYEACGRLHGARQGIYLGPLRLLAAEQFETLNLRDVPCSLVTGEEQIRVPGSRVQSSTVEMADMQTHYDVAVIDECQMIADRDRGGAWTAAILGLCADEIHLCASPDAELLLTQMVLDCGDTLSVTRHERMTPLVVQNEGFRFPESVRPGDALIVFSKARVHAAAAELRQRGFRVSLIYGALPPDVRRSQARSFQQGENDVVVSTDAIAMGMNLPIERVVFLESEKYDGDIVRPLTDAEIKQIAGRAGRYGQYDTGYVNAFGFRGSVARALAHPLPPLTEAYIRFPESLLGIPLPLSAIIDRWQAMKDKGFFSKASSERMARLTQMMETRDTDKTLLYRFVCIPFDETEQDLLTLWRRMYRAECEGEHLDAKELLPEPVDPESCVTAELDGLEADYRRCDLMYNYVRLFLPFPDEILQEIQRRKDLISQGIIHILSTQKLRTRTCSGCGRSLPWNWPYPLCDSCHRGAPVRHSNRRR
ncbi:MAG: helicase [Clostridia bacterium]|nr:helicase [Clostridia bacterium]